MSIENVLPEEEESQKEETEEEDIVLPVKKALHAVVLRSIRFTTRLYDTFRDFDNVTASPLSAELLLTLLYLGSTNHSAKDVATTLDIPANRLNCLNGYNQLTALLQVCPLIMASETRVARVPWDN
uniref:(California timema) hypothetical protein n=1 Tax=Timema californicum TaxID=61474 RepID=A0A7R9PGJ6_TIMCA|nr:unnamed protein product [Timema californicum]